MRMSMLMVAMLRMVMMKMMAPRTWMAESSCCLVESRSVLVLSISALSRQFSAWLSSHS